jgi:alanyl aminopeptidase
MLGALVAQAEGTSDYRLPAGIAPVSQVIELDIDPSRADFTGRTRIDLEIDRKTDRIGINQVGLALTDIVLASGAGERRLDASDGEWERSWLADGEPIEPGEYTLSIEFNGEYSTDALGMHRVTFEGNDYVFTQMEVMYARRAFPVFDEPAFKIPYRMIIRTPKGLTAVANTPVESTEEQGDWQRVTFMESPPLPSYLIAYAVGPLDRAPIEGMSVTGHVYTPKGHTDKLGYVLRETPAIVAALEDYFGLDYPYRKLDFIAVPEFAFGAMENPGLITYRTDLLLVGDDVSGTQAVRVLGVIAHEVAHIWFGDVVTMAWWDDLWLNEAFASWMANTILEREYPQLETGLRLPQRSAFGADELTSSKPIRKTVRNEAEITDGLGLNYTKGHALLRMLERYVGPDVWQRGVRSYIRKYAWSNATERDLWAVIGAEAGQDIAKIAGDYLNQPGFATVAIDASGKVSQSRYVREGLEAPPLLWRIPLNVKYKSGGEIRQTFMLLDGAEGSLDVPGNSEWIFPDAGGNGYFRWRIDPGQFDNLVADIDALSARERIALLDNSEALLNAGALSMTEYLGVVSRLLADPHPLVFLPALENVTAIGEDFATGARREPFARFVDGALSGRFAEVGVERRPHDTEAVIQMRPRLLRTLGQFGGDAAAITAAARLTDAYFESPQSVQSQLALEAMRVTALAEGAKRYDQYRKAYLASGSPDQRSSILAAMYFDDPAIVRRHLDFSLTDAVQAGDALSALSYFGYVLQDHSVLYDWLEDNIDRLVAKAPSVYQPLLPELMNDACSRENLAMLRAFFAERGDIYARSLAKTEERVQACIDRRERHMDDFEAFFARAD